MKLFRTRFQVLPTRGGFFPIDMLRYEAAYPASESDSGKMQNRCGPHFEPVEPVTIEKLHHSDKSPHLCDGRWQSFGWKIVPESVVTEEVRV
ncbi:MAG TPA: hypothetical protein VEU74_11965 [Gemmatimonadales bacterium]|nr:hypothetical protein [Gemmatimonadales bacterium]